MLILDSLNDLPGVEIEIVETRVMTNMKGDRLPYHKVSLHVESVEMQGAHNAMTDLIVRLEQFVNTARISLELEE